MKKLLITTTAFLIGGVSVAHQGEHPGKKRIIKVSIGEDGFKPAQIEGSQGEDLILLITRTTDKTCMTELKNVNGKGETELPLNKEVRFQVGHLEKAGEIKLLCGMDMKAGVVKVL